MGICLQQEITEMMNLGSLSGCLRWDYTSDHFFEVPIRRKFWYHNSSAPESSKQPYLLRFSK